MTPLQIRIMLHYHYSPTDFKDCAGPVVPTTIRDFYDAGMLEDCPVVGVKTRITDKGRAYCKALECVPEPVCMWLIPAADSV